MLARTKKFPLLNSISETAFFRKARPNGSARPKSEEAKQWAEGMERLLESKYGTALFRAFLQRNHAEENLDFILKVDKYKEIETLDRRKKFAWELYCDFISVGAPHELNLDVMTRKVTELGMLHPHLTTFDTARARIFNLLSNDSFLRFLTWDVYTSLVLSGDENDSDENVRDENGRGERRRRDQNGAMEMRQLR